MRLHIRYCRLKTGSPSNLASTLPQQDTVYSRRKRVSRQNTQTRPVHIVAHPFDTWVTGPLVDRATRLDEREDVGHVEFAIQLNAAARPRSGPCHGPGSRRRNPANLGVHE